MTAVLRVLRSRFLRAAFLVVALAAAVVAVAGRWDGLVAAVARAPGWTAPAAFAAGLLYLGAAFGGWRAVMRAMGAPLRMADAFGLFFVSQLGKYVPGGVWNMVAVGELGADLHVPRRRSVSAMVIALLISVVSGIAVAAPTVLLSAGAARYAWVWIVVPVLAALLAPPVLDRILRWGMRLLRQDPVEHDLTTKGVLTAVVWTLLGWLAAGTQVWMLGVALGMSTGWRTYALCVGGYALAWVVGFLVVFAPAGVGAREVVLLALLSGVVDDATVLAVVLLSRVLLTAGDVILSLVGLVVMRRRARLDPAGGVGTV